MVFERLSEQKALKRHPELQEAYETMRKASSYFMSKMPGKIEAQKTAIQSAKDHIQLRLNAGEISGFSQDLDQIKPSARGA